MECGRSMVLRRRPPVTELDELDPDYGSGSDPEDYWSQESDGESRGLPRVPETGFGALQLPWDDKVRVAHEPEGGEDCFSVPALVFEGDDDWEQAWGCVWSWSRWFPDPGFDYWGVDEDADRVGSLRMWALRPWGPWDGLTGRYCRRRSHWDPRPFAYEVDPTRRPTWNGVTMGEALDRRSVQPGLHAGTRGSAAVCGSCACVQRHQQCLVTFPADARCGQCGVVRPRDFLEACSLQRRKNVLG